jgi:hypothetical protein
VLGAPAEDRIEPESEKGGDQGQDDNFNDHLHCFPVISAAAPRLSRDRSTGWIAIVHQIGADYK